MVVFLLPQNLYFLALLYTLVEIADTDVSLLFIPCYIFTVGCLFITLLILGEELVILFLYQNDQEGVGEGEVEWRGVKFYLPCFDISVWRIEKKLLH